jgi:hypothetical protein
MAEHLRLARLFWLLLAIFTIGRLAMTRLPYATFHHVFSLVTLTAFATIFYGAFTRRWKDYRVLQAMTLGAIIGLSAQVVIFTATVVSYALGIDTYFTNPRALLGFNAPPDPVPFTEALLRRSGGLVGNTITAAIMAALGWVMGGLLPADKAKDKPKA